MYPSATVSPKKDRAEIPNFRILQLLPLAGGPCGQKKVLQF